MHGGKQIDSKKNSRNRTYSEEETYWFKMFLGTSISTWAIDCLNRWKCRMNIRVEWREWMAWERES